MGGKNFKYIDKTLTKMMLEKVRQLGEQLEYKMFGIIPAYFLIIGHEFTILKLSRGEHGKLQDSCVHEEKIYPEEAQ